jgi:hypothetical protein
MCTVSLRSRASAIRLSARLVGQSCFSEDRNLRASREVLVTRAVLSTSVWAPGQARRGRPRAVLGDARFRVAAAYGNRALHVFNRFAGGLILAKTTIR